MTIIDMGLELTTNFYNVIDKLFDTLQQENTFNEPKNYIAY